MSTPTPVPNLLNLPAELGQLILKWAVAKYIEGAGSAAGAMTARAASLKALTTEVDGVVLGTITLQQLAAMTAAELAAKNIPESTQMVISGLVAILPPLLPTTGLLAAAGQAVANTFLQDVISVCTSYGA